MSLVSCYCRYRLSFIFHSCNCSFQNPEGQMMLRVTTITRRWIDSSVSSEVCSVSCHFWTVHCFGGWGVSSRNLAFVITWFGLAWLFNFIFFLWAFHIYVAWLSSDIYSNTHTDLLSYKSCSLNLLFYVIWYLKLLFHFVVLFC